MSDKAGDEQEAVPMATAANLERVVPKFCTTVNLALMNNKNIVLTMLYGENIHQATLIERVVIDIEHARSLVDTLKRVLEEADRVAS